MTLLPFENIEIESPLTEGEIENAIKNNVAWRTEFRPSIAQNSYHEFEGFVDSGTFKIRRILKWGRTPFIPLVTGTISKSGNGSKVQLKFRLHKFVMRFLIVMTIFHSIMFLPSLISRLQSGLHTKEDYKEYLMEHSLDEELAEDVVSNIEINPWYMRTEWSSFIILFALYLMSTIFFNYETNIIKGKLNSILKI